MIPLPYALVGGAKPKSFIAWRLERSVFHTTWTKGIGALADAAKGSADRAAAAIDSAMDFIAVSNERIAALGAKVAKP